MARPLRIDLPNSIHHCMSRGNERRPIFKDDADMQRFLRLVLVMCAQFDLRLHAYALMPNHFHMLIAAIQGGLSKGMHWLNGTYSQYFNRRHGRVGHLFQGRFKSVLIQDDDYFLSVSRYIHRNPVKAGLAREPWDYAWSSCRDYLGLRTPPEWLDSAPILDFFEGDGAAGYREYLSQSKEEDPLCDAVADAILGDGEFIEGIVTHLPSATITNPEVTKRAQFRKKNTIEEINTVFATLNLAAERGVPWSRAAGRSLEMYFLHERARLTHSEIGRLFQISRPAVTKQLLRLSIRMEEDETTSQLAATILTLLDQMSHFKG